MFLREVFPLLRRPLSFQEARATIRRQLDERDNAWLSSLETNVYTNPRSPYLPLLRRAGCEFGDIRDSVRRDGLESTLRTLRNEGVYVSFDEFKAREPIVRGDLVVHARPEDFHNPRLGGCLTGASGGTTGAPTTVPLTALRIGELTLGRLLTHHAHHLAGARLAVWRPFAYGGLVHLLTDAAIGLPDERWFASPHSHKWTRAAGEHIAVTAIRAMARSARTRIPRPEFIDPDQTVRVARWASLGNGSSFLATGVSQGVRIAAEAREHGLDLSRLTLFVSGEPPTPAKVKIIRGVGIRVLPHYATTEAGRLAIGCASPAGDTDMHVLTDLVAVTQYAKRLANGLVVEPISVTTLRPNAVMILLNVDTDDYGQIHERACGCAFDEAGYGVHLSSVYSFGKLTSEGVSLVGTQVQRILEEDLPSRFGGSPLDYQLVEEEDETGCTRIALLVSPRVEVTDDAQIVDAFLQALGRSALAVDIKMIWRMANTLRVRRCEPIATPAGKILPLAPAHLNPYRRT